MVERVLVVGPKDTISMVDDLAPKGFEIVKALHNSPEMKAALPGTTYFVGFVQQYVTPQLFKESPKLKLIQMLSAGYDRADLEAARKSKIPLCNNGGANSVAVSEHALLLMLAVSRRLITQHANVTAGRWHGNAPPTVHEVRNKVLGIVGLGTIGKKVARLAKAFGMVVHYYDIKRLKEEEEDALGVRFRLLPEILRHSDILSLHVPLNASTQSMIGAAELAAMKPSAWLINIARGDMIEEAALLDALHGRKIAGAFLDPTNPEPLPPEHPLWSAPNCMITMHLSGRSQTKMFQRAAALFLRNIDAFVNGRALENVVDLDAGY
jgi:glyoxylate reductase/D-3-phosphoglycerate dehydrogenase